MITQKPLYYWVLKKNRTRQLLILCVILFSVAMQVLPLELQKRIVNVAISSGDMTLLLTYATLFFIAFVLFGLLKFAVNMMQARLGQAILCDIRCQLHAHILQLPLVFFRTHPPGTVINALSGELSEVGHFIGGALAVPMTIILTLLAFGGYMIYLDPLLAAISLSIYPIEIILIPQLQKRYNQYNQRRISTLREMNDAINESITGIHEIQSNAVFGHIGHRFDTIAHTLMQGINQLFLVKYTIKMVNNMFQNTGPLLLFVFGGYLAIRGSFSLGALVAFLSAYEKVYDPWKELIGFYQGYQDAVVRYRRVMETFNVKPEFDMVPSHRSVVSLTGKVETRHLSYSVKSGIDLLREVSLQVQPGEHLAIVGFSGSGKSTLAMLIGQLYQYRRGEIFLDSQPLRQLTKMDISRNIGYVAQHPYIFDTTIRDNILLGFSPHVIRDGGNAFDPLPPQMPNIDEMSQLLTHLGLVDDLLKIALENPLPKTQSTSSLNRRLTEEIVSLRPKLRSRLSPELHRRIELFDVDSFLSHTSIYGNLVFSDGLSGDLAPQTIARNSSFIDFLKKHDLYEELLCLGHQIIRQSVVLLKNLSDDPFFFKSTPIPTEAMPHYDTLLKKYPACQVLAMSGEDKNEFLTLALTHIPALHKIATVSQPFQTKIIHCRKAFLKEFIALDYHNCTRAMHALIKGKCAFQIATLASDLPIFCPAGYIPSRSVMENFLFGSVQTAYASAWPSIKAIVTELLQENDSVFNALIDAALDYNTGSQGSKLSGGQKQKIAIARALIKKPSILILDEATASLDNQSQQKIQSYISQHLKGGTTVLSVIHRLDLLEEYDTIVVLKDGKMVEQGVFHELIKKKEHCMNWCMANDPDLNAITSQSILEQNMDVLRKLPAFKLLEFEIINLFALMADRQNYLKGEVIFFQGDRISKAFMILQGSVTLYFHQDNQSMDLEQLHCGDQFGYMALLADMDAKLSARAATDAELLTIDREHFRKVMIRYPESCIHVVEKLIQERMGRMERHMQKIFSTLQSHSKSSDASFLDSVRNIGL